ncbi:MAG: P1 family peptidase [Pseudomonadota bacterium]
MLRTICLCTLLIAQTNCVVAEEAPRARDLGIPFDGVPGPNNAITDVEGVEVGYTTLIDGTGPLIIGEGPVRTGVTAIHPRGKHNTEGAFAARFTMNGDGEMTGIHWVDEFGTLFGPILLTNTYSVADVHVASREWMRDRDPDDMFHLPVVAETWDGTLNDMYGRHITQDHVFQALNSATSGKIAEGNVGGGTGMISFGFKAGTGTSLRKVGPYTIGVLVQANFGLPWRLTVAGVPVGETLNPDEYTHSFDRLQNGNSIMGIIATDAPLLPMQLERFAKRSAMGVARVGGVAERGSGEIFLAFSTANPLGYSETDIVTYEAITDDARFTLDYLYEGVVQATEEAIINALIAADTMVGADDVTVERLDHETLRQILREHNRLDEAE